MIEVYHKLYVGDEHDYNSAVARQPNWAVVQACKLPYHRLALGYTTAGAPQGHPEYYIARRGDRLILNMVDAPRPEFFSKDKLIDPALDFLDEVRQGTLSVLIHCNQGESRGPSIALLYLSARLGVLPTDSFDAAEEAFTHLYPSYKPKFGIREHLRLNWQRYCEDGEQRRRGTTG